MSQPTPLDGPVLADGFACARIEVMTDRAALPGVTAAINGLKKQLAQGETALVAGFPDRLLERFRALPGVVRVEVQPPTSAILVPVHLIRRYAGRPVTFSAALGTGPVARFVAEMMTTEGIDCRWATNPASDSPIEVGVRGAARAECIRLYVPRRLKHVYAPPKSDLESAGGFVLSVFNKGRARTAAAVRARGGFTTLRVGELGRYVTAEDYLGILDSFHHLFVSTRGHSLRQVARAAGYDPPRGWPARFDALGRRLAEDLASRDPGRLVVLHYHEAQEAAFVLPGHPPAVVRAPARLHDGASRAGRLHGACAALALKCPHVVPLVGYRPTPEHLGAFADRAMQLAYSGTDRLPWQTPGPDFTTSNSWLV